MPDQVPEDRDPKTFAETPVSPTAHAARWRRLVRRRNTIIGIWLGGLACDLIVPFSLMAMFPSLKNLGLALMVGLCVCWFSACLIGLMLEGSLNQYFQQTLLRKDLSCLGCWIDILCSPISRFAYPQSVRNQQEAARTGLLEQLPHLSEDTAYLLGASERRALYKMLQGTDTELIRVVLSAIPVFGDSRALPFVRHLAEGKGMAASDADLRAQAQSVLDTLQSEIARSSGARGLLRASQQPPPSTAELLIPAHENRETEANELVRADIQS